MLCIVVIKICIIVKVMRDININVCVKVIVCVWLRELITIKFVFVSVCYMRSYYNECKLINDFILVFVFCVK